MFDGSSGPYGEDDPTNPINEYGRQKVALERLARSAERHLICRTSGVFGWERGGKNFVCQLVSHLRAGREFAVPSDQAITPTYAPDLATAVVRLLDEGRTSTFHVVGPQVLRRPEFARLVADAFSLPASLIVARPTTELGIAAPRPMNAGLRDDKLRAGAAREPENIRERLQLESDFMRDALSRIAADPLGYLAHRATVVPALWVQPAVYAGHFLAPFQRQNPKLEQMLATRDVRAIALRLASIVIFTVGLFVGFAAGAWLGRAAWREQFPLYAPALYVAAFLSPIWIEHRYSVLSHPFLWLVAASGILWLSDRALVLLRGRRFDVTPTQSDRQSDA